MSDELDLSELDRLENQPIDGFPGYVITGDGHVLSFHNWRGQMPHVMATHADRGNAARALIARIRELEAMNASKATMVEQLSAAIFSNSELTALRADVARKDAALHQIISETSTVGSDYGLPHVANIARAALTPGAGASDKHTDTRGYAE